MNSPGYIVGFDQLRMSDADSVGGKNAGQQERFFNTHGLDNVLDAIRRVFASLYNDRAISYRIRKGFEHLSVSLSAGVKKMMRSGQGASGVMFSADTESGFQEWLHISRIIAGREAAAGANDMISTVSRAQ